MLLHRGFSELITKSSRYEYSQSASYLSEFHHAKWSKILWWRWNFDAWRVVGPIRFDSKKTRSFPSKSSSAAPLLYSGCHCDYKPDYECSHEMSCNNSWVASLSVLGPSAHFYLRLRKSRIRCRIQQADSYRTHWWVHWLKQADILPCSSFKMHN